METCTITLRGQKCSLISIDFHSKGGYLIKDLGLVESLFVPREQTSFFLVGVVLKVEPSPLLISMKN